MGQGLAGPQNVRFVKHFFKETMWCRCQGQNLVDMLAPKAKQQRATIAKSQTADTHTCVCKAIHVSAHVWIAAGCEFLSFTRGPEVLVFFNEVLYKINILVPSKPDPHFEIFIQGKSNATSDNSRSGF